MAPRDIGQVILLGSSPLCSSACKRFFEENPLRLMHTLLALNGKAMVIMFTLAATHLTSRSFAKAPADPAAGLKRLQSAYREGPYRQRFQF